MTNRVDKGRCAICKKPYSMNDLFDYGNDWVCERCLRKEDEMREDMKSVMEDWKYHEAVDEGKIR